MEIKVRSESELPAVARRLLQVAGDRRVLAFTGEIGAGKTTLIQAFCRQLGVTGEVTSPTFALVNEYVCPDPVSGEERPVYHLDLYRLRDLEEALAIGIEEYLDAGAWCLIEWPELIEPLLPEDVVRINIEITKNSERKILFL